MYLHAGPGVQAQLDSVITLSKTATPTIVKDCGGTAVK
jgi:hypothetical protein